MLSKQGLCFCMYNITGDSFVCVIGEINSGRDPILQNL